MEGSFEGRNILPDRSYHYGKVLWIREKCLLLVSVGYSMQIVFVAQFKLIN